MATFGAYVQSVTQDEIVPSVVDGILSGNVLVYRLFGNGKRWSGEALTRPLFYTKNTSGGSFSGFDTLSTAQVSTRVRLSFDIRAFYQSVVLSNIDIAVNATQARVLDLVKVEMETAKLSMMDSVGSLIYGTGTGNSNKDFLGLGAAVDDGTDVATYGTLSRTTYATALNSSVTTSVGALTVARMATAFDAAEIGADHPTLIVTTPTVWTFYEALLQPTVRAEYNAYGYPQVGKSGMAKPRAAFTGDIGFDALTFRGVPVVKDEKCTSQAMFFLNEKWLEWRGLKHPQHGEVKTKVQNIATNAIEDYTPMVGCAWTGLKEPVNQDAEIGQFLLYGNLICWQPRTQAKLTGITS